MPSWDELFIKVRSYQNYRAYMDLYDENGTFLLRLDEDFDPLRNYNEYDFGHWMKIYLISYYEVYQYK